jgi:hypothetical protein
MNQSTYPKIKYQGVEIKPGQHQTENPGYIYQKVNNVDEEAALEGDWHDTPRAAIDAFGPRKGAPQKDAAGAPVPRNTEDWPTESEKKGKR